MTMKSFVKNDLGSRGIIACLFASVAYAAQAAAPAPITLWNTQSDIVPGNPTQMAGAVSLDNLIYMIGGYNTGDAGDTDDVVRWTALTYSGFLSGVTEVTPLPTKDNFSYLFETCDVSTPTRTIYIAGGGYNPTAPVNRTNTTFATVDSFGNLPASWTVSADFPGGYGPELGGGVVCSGYFYAFGGDSESGTPPSYDLCFYAKINNDGTLGAWQTGTTLPDVDANAANGTGWYFPGVTAIGDYIIANPGIHSGDTDNTRVTDAVYVCHVNPATGAMGPWVRQSTVLPEPRYNVGLIDVGTTLFAVGGRVSGGGSAANVWRAEFDPATGTVGAWSSTDAQLPDAVRYHAVVFNEVTERIYVVGIRRGPTGATVSNEAYYSNPLFEVPPPTGAKGMWTLYQ